MSPGIPIPGEMEAPDWMLVRVRHGQFQEIDCGHLLETAVMMARGTIRNYPANGSFPVGIHVLGDWVWEADTSRMDPDAWARSLAAFERDYLGEGATPEPVVVTPMVRHEARSLRWRRFLKLAVAAAARAWIASKTGGGFR